MDAYIPAVGDVFYDPSIESDLIGSYAYETRDASGSGTAYKTLNDARLNKASGRVILRGGEIEYTGQINDSSAGNWYIFPGEIVTLIAAGDNNILLLSVPNIEYSTGILKLEGPEMAISKYAFRMNTEGQYADCLVDTRGVKGIAYGAASAVSVSIMAIAFDGDAARPFRSAVAGATLNVDCAYSEQKGISDVENAAITVNIRQWFMNGSGIKSAVETKAGIAGTVNIDNAIMLGCVSRLGTLPAFETGDSGTIALSNSIVHNKLHDVSNTDSGTGSMTRTNTVTTDPLVKFKDFGGQPHVVIGFYDSSVANSLSGDPNLDEYRLALGHIDKGLAPLSYFPDDSNAFLNANFIDPLDAWIRAGHELGMWGRGGGDSWGVDAELTITYGGVGTGTIIISEDGKQLQLLVNGAVQYTFDTATDSKDTKYLNYLNSSDSLYAAINAAGVVDWSASESAISTYDDAYSIMLASGLYNSGDTIQFDETRRFYWEITDHRAQLYANTGYQPKSFLAQGGSNNQALSSYVQSEGLQAMVAQGNNQSMTRGDQVNPQSIAPMWTTETAAMFIGGTQSESEASARRLSSYLWANGGTSVLMFGFGLGAITGTELKYMVDELLASGVQIIPASEIKASTIGRDITKLELHEDSAGYSHGAQWWTGPNPLGMDHQPIPNYDISCGPVAKRGTSHPKNLV